MNTPIKSTLANATGIGPDKPLGDAPQPDQPEKPTRRALERLGSAIEHLDTQTQTLNSELEDLLRPQHPSPTCETEQKDQKDHNPVSHITTSIETLTTSIETLITRIEDILTRLEI